MHVCNPTCTHTNYTAFNKQPTYVLSLSLSLSLSLIHTHTHTHYPKLVTKASHGIFPPFLFFPPSRIDDFICRLMHLSFLTVYSCAEPNADILQLGYGLKHQTSLINMHTLLKTKRVTNVRMCARAHTHTHTHTHTHKHILIFFKMKWLLTKTQEALCLQNIRGKQNLCAESPKLIRLTPKNVLPKKEILP